MANTTTFKGRTIHIKLDGSTDWSWNSSTEIAAAPQLGDLSVGSKVWIDSITFDPAAAGDGISVREGSLSGAIMFHASGGDTYDQRSKDMKGRDFGGIFISAADVTSTGGNASVTIMLR